MLVLFVLPAAAQAGEQKLIAAAGAAGDFLGGSVAVDGDTAVSALRPSGILTALIPGVARCMCSRARATAGCRPPS